MSKYLLFLLTCFNFHMHAQNADICLLRRINIDRNKDLDPTFRFLSNTTTPVSIACPLVMMSVGYFKKDSSLMEAALYVGASLISTSLLSTALKYSIHRPRPFVSYPDIQKASDAGSPSFPSGHTSDAFALATSASLKFPKWYVIAPAFAWACSVGYSRMHLGVHYPSDVFAGAVLGTATAILCHKLEQGLCKKQKTRIPSPD